MKSPSNLAEYKHFQMLSGELLFQPLDRSASLREQDDLLYALKQPSG